MSPRALPTLVAVALATVLTLGGCSTEDGQEPTSHGDHMGQDGGTPGAAHTDGHDGHDMQAMPDLPTPSAGADWNTADAEYLSMMLAHHRQAIVMSQLVPVRAASPQVVRLARSIDAGQGREILVMADWLDDRGLPVPDLAQAEAMAASGMHGMLGPDEIAALENASGPEFDRLFLEGMIRHHRGAIAMAQDELGAGSNVSVREWATDVVAGQGAEISRMEDLLAALA